MPIYEYTCQKCKAHVEVMQKVSDKPLTRHSKCGGKLEKEWSQTSFQLKGSGWYVTDYAGKKTDAKEGAEAKESKSAKSDAATTSEKTEKTASEKPAKEVADKPKEKTPKPSAAKTSTGGATGD